MSGAWNRREFLGLSGASLIANATGAGLAKGVSVSGHSSPHAAEPKQRSTIAKWQNLIIYVPDEMRADSLACYGNPVTKTPNFDRLAKEGARFENCHVQYPVCGASRCALLTGWPTSVRGHRSLYYFLRSEEPNLFRYLRQADYDVFWYGKNDALAAASFYDSVTAWNDGSSFLGRPNIQDRTPGSYWMLYSAAGDRRDTYDYKLLQMAFKVLERKETDRRSACSSHSFNPTRRIRFRRISTTSTRPPVFPR